MEGHAATVSVLLFRVDNLENRRHRSNHPFYGIRDANSESWQMLEAKIIITSKDKLGITIDSLQVERAHRPSLFRQGKTRPIILKVYSYKIKNELLLSELKLKGSTTSLSEDYPLAVHMAQKSLLSFAKTQELQFKHCFDKTSDWFEDLHLRHCNSLDRIDWGVNQQTAHTQIR